MGVRVVKVGGSLFAHRWLPDRLRQWLAGEPACNTLVVTGGGALADGVRNLDQRFGLDHMTSHELAVETMRMHARVLLTLLPDAEWVVHTAGWHLRVARTDGPLLGVLEPSYFIVEDQRGAAGAPLPCGWHVTSDSIAARAARTVGASQLVLLKTTLPAEQPVLSAQQAVAAGYVDDYFPVAAEQLEIRAVNLADPDFPETRIDA